MQSFSLKTRHKCGGLDKMRALGKREWAIMINDVKGACTTLADNYRIAQGGGKHILS
jgi:hypothetical protein